MKIAAQTKMISDLIDSVKISDVGYANKYKCTIKYQKRQATFEYTDSVNNTNQGIEPKVKDLLSCLVMDYSSKDEDFDEFCSEFGYDNDSIKAQKIHQAIIKNADKMMRVFRGDIKQLTKEFEDY